MYCAKTSENAGNTRVFLTKARNDHINITRLCLPDAGVIIRLKKGDKVQIVGFGTFEVSERQARTGRNPHTGETMEIEASKAPRFKAGKALKDAINA